MRIVDTGSFRYIRESAIAVVVKEKIARALQAPWTALHGETVILAGLARTEFRKVVEVKVDVMGDEEVYPTVAIVVAESGAGGELSVIQAGLLSHIGKSAVAVVG